MLMSQIHIPQLSTHSMVGGGIAFSYIVKKNVSDQGNMDNILKCDLLQYENLLISNCLTSKG